ncbi:hypothetical protein PFAG_02418 [Plasmodium falciparum Santa Lucia]|uniref:Uncharacterized protein n=4 Tax=Plasmodium falciparum TaxID=5833 RepID=W7JLV8_PLAFO|nr:hypothetical protein PFMALIP_02463 [Plasmodium falciparum MaliPS096_E11]ETW61774.1 hypothetical protein PFMC_02426 [Plasmodium falciparum CAMP/Malaysia]EUT86549.1 hypothetical protein PFAG_02418 [Plasmodium falciparum Santa Lucia]EWC85873.1 hypothetical protein PFNF54_05540 [Plasmodium falciparum NF54]
MNCYTYSQIVYESFHVEYTKNDSINIKIYICHCSYSNLKYIPNNMKVYCIKQVNQFPIEHKYFISLLQNNS